MRGAHLAALAALVLSGCAAGAAYPPASTVRTSPPASAPASSSAAPSSQAAPDAPALSWTCAVTNVRSAGVTYPSGDYMFGYSATATNTGTSEADVSGYSLVVYDAAGNEIYSTPDSPWSQVIEPGQSMTAEYQDAAAVVQAEPVSCQVPDWYG